MDNTQFEAPEEKKTVFKILGIPIFSRTEIKTVKYETTDLYQMLGEKLSADLKESLAKAGIRR